MAGAQTTATSHVAPAYERPTGRNDSCQALPGVKNSKSYIVMEEVKESLGLPINPNQPRN